MERIEGFRGLYYGQILDWVGALPDENVFWQDRTVLRTWREEGYMITLWFDREDRCLGVWDEKNKKFGGMGYVQFL